MHRASEHSDDSTVWRLIAAATALRLLLAEAMGLGIDESYMAAAGRVWAWSYFDHPPLSWWLAHGMAALLGIEAGFMLRLPFVGLFALSTWLLYRLTADLSGPRAGLWAAVALTVSPVFGVAAATWILPDGPLDAALLAFALCLIRALRAPGWRWWLAAGAAAGLAMLSKYSAALVIAGGAAGVLTHPAHRRWLARPHPYAAALLALALFAPVLAWNAGHGWASFAFQGGRAGGEPFNPLGPLRVLGGEAAFLLPWLWLPLIAVWVQALRAGPRADPAGWLLSCLGALPVLLFAGVGLWSRHVLFHWAAPGYLMLLPLLGRALAGWDMQRPRLLRSVAWGSAGLVLAGAGLLCVQLQYAPWRLPGARDPALQALDWTGVAEALAARGLQGRNVVAATGWQDAGKLGYALGPDWRVLCLNRDARQFGQDARPIPDGPVAVLSFQPVDAAWLAAQGWTAARFSDRPPLDVPLPGGRMLRLNVTIAEGLRRDASP